MNFDNMMNIMNKFDKIADDFSKVRGNLKSLSETKKAENMRDARILMCVI